MTVGIVFADLASPLQADGLEGLIQGVQQHGFMALATTSANRVENTRTILHQFLERRVDAVILQTPSGLGKPPKH